MLNYLYRGYQATVKRLSRDVAQNALHCPCLVSEIFFYLLMSTCHSLRLHSPLKKVLTKLETPYQTYFNMYKTHTMASHHRGTGQPLEKNLYPQDQDIDIPSNYQHGDIDDFENVENEYHTQLERPN